MKIINTLVLVLFISIMPSTAFSEEKYDCSNIESSTLTSVAKKLWCKQNNKELIPKISLGEKLKNLNPFKKKTK